MQEVTTKARIYGRTRVEEAVFGAMNAVVRVRSHVFNASRPKEEKAKALAGGIRRRVSGRHFLSSSKCKPT